jgi:hypothetical protein
VSRGAKRPAARKGAKRRLADARAMIVYHGVEVRFFEHGYFCRIPVKDVAIDADGAPNAYGPRRDKKDKHGSGLDSLTAAGFPTPRDDPIDDDWRDVLVPDLRNQNEPFLKEDGYYISKTSLCDESAKSDAAPGKYVDAVQVSYIVMPQLWLGRLGLQLGDLCLLWHSRINRKVVAVVADTCPVDEPLGEMSIATAKSLGGRNVSARDGVDFPGTGAICCVMFMGSRPDIAWPITDAFVQSFKKELGERMGALIVR